MQEWEQLAATATYQQVRQFVLLTNGSTQRLTKEQKGRFVCLCWIGQIYRSFATPKESYIADWEQLPEWQRETDIAIFEAIERAVQSARESQGSIRESSPKDLHTPLRVLSCLLSTITARLIADFVQTLCSHTAKKEPFLRLPFATLLLIDMRTMFFYVCPLTLVFIALEQQKADGILTHDN